MVAWSELGRSWSLAENSLQVAVDATSQGTLASAENHDTCVGKSETAIDDQRIDDKPIVFGRTLGVSEQMRRLYPLLQRLASSDVPVIIEGETGTGKEVLAESLHAQSRRANGPFVVFDCTAVSPNLVESALFGHERGAFTGAIRREQGVFEQANGGTLLIDEMGDLDWNLQPKLLRAVERSEIRRVGGKSWIKTDIRVLCATRRNLQREVQAGRFRDDLYYRLAVARVELPPLRERRADIILLSKYFWRKLGGDDREIPADFLRQVQEHEWPGNVRELQNAVANRLALGDLKEGSSGWQRLAAGEAPRPPERGRPRASEEVAAPASSSSDDVDLMDSILKQELPFPIARERVLRAFEQRYVEWMVGRHSGSMSKAAAASGLTRRSLYAIKSRASKVAL